MSNESSCLAYDRQKAAQYGDKFHKSADRVLADMEKEHPDMFKGTGQGLSLAYIRVLTAWVCQAMSMIETLQDAGKHAPAYRGVYKSGEHYKRGEFATHQGGLWHCNRNTGDSPGSSDAWQLSVKRGALA